jgi:hypothetical protein
MRLASLKKDGQVSAALLGAGAVLQAGGSRPALKCLRIDSHSTGFAFEARQGSACSPIKMALFVLKRALGIAGRRGRAQHPSDYGKALVGRACPDKIADGADQGGGHHSRKT